MPSIWLTGISHSLKSAASWSSAMSRSSNSRLVFSPSLNPAGSIAASRSQKVLLPLQPLVHRLHASSR